MPRPAQQRKIFAGRMQCSICRIAKPLNLFRLVEPKGRSAYYFPECLECISAKEGTSVRDAEVQGWPCQYCPKRPTCQTECFIYRAYVDGDIQHPSTLQKLIGMMV